jgi:hypothetical protein
VSSVASSRARRLRVAREGAVAVDGCGVAGVGGGGGLASRDGGGGASSWWGRRRVGMDVCGAGGAHVNARRLYIERDFPCGVYLAGAGRAILMPGPTAIFRPHLPKCVRPTSQDHVMGLGYRRKLVETWRTRTCQRLIPVQLPGWDLYGVGDVMLADVSSCGIAGNTCAEQDGHVLGASWHTRLAPDIGSSDLIKDISTGGLRTVNVVPQSGSHD